MRRVLASEIVVLLNLHAMQMFGRVWASETVVLLNLHAIEM